jgi:molybdopterin synthase sulfur carrier subunit
LARVILTYSFAKQFADGQTEIELPGRTVRQLIRALEARFPALEGKLEGDIAVVIDGVVHQNAFLEEVAEDSEVAFIPPIGGGTI